MRKQLVGEVHNEFDTTVDKLAEYLILFKDTLAATQFARTTISDAEVKECADAIFSNPVYHQLDLATEIGKEKLYELQYREYEKRDETMLISFSADETYQERSGITRNIRTKILKPVEFTNPAAEDLFGEWYKGQPGDIIYMARQHYTYFHHKGCVEFANSTLSEKDVTGEQMTYDGFEKCEDDKVWLLLLEDVDFLMPATDEKGHYHLFYRRGNDWFSYWRPFLQKGDTAVVRPGFGYREPIQIVVDSVNTKDGQLIIDYTHNNEKCWAYLSQIESIAHI